jgi:hypothetical protein
MSLSAEGRKRLRKSKPGDARPDGNDGNDGNGGGNPRPGRAHLVTNAGQSGLDFVKPSVYSSKRFFCSLSLLTDSYDQGILLGFERACPPQNDKRPLRGILEGY